MASDSWSSFSDARVVRQPGDYLARDVLATGDGRDQQDAVAILDGAGFAAEEADVFVVEIHVEELANLALVVADVAAEVGKFGGQLVQCFSNRDGATVDFRLAVGKAPEGCWDFNDYWHICRSLSLWKFFAFAKAEILNR
jgi:hypothetical protein